MSERKICVSKSWLQPLELGMLLKTISPRDAYAGQTMEIVGVVHDKKDVMDGRVILKLEKPDDGKMTANPRFWWVYEHCALVGHVKDEKR